MRYFIAAILIFTAGLVPVLVLSPTQAADSSEMANGGGLVLCDGQQDALHFVLKPGGKLERDKSETPFPDGHFQEQDLGVLVLDAPRSIDVLFRFPLGTLKPDEVLFGKPCCTKADMSENWSERPEIKMMIVASKSQGQFVWTAEGRRKDRAIPVFQIVAKATILPRSAFRLKYDESIEIPEGTKRKVEGVLEVIYPNSERPPDHPRIATDEKTKLMWADEVSTEEAHRGYRRSIQAFAMEIGSDAGDVIDHRIVEANFSGASSETVRWTFPVRTLPALTAAPRAALVREENGSRTNFTVESRPGKLIERHQISAKGEIRVARVELSADKRVLRVEVNCERTGRGLAGQVQIETYVGAIQVPVYRLGAKS